MDGRGGGKRVDWTSGDLIRGNCFVLRAKQLPGERSELLGARRLDSARLQFHPALLDTPVIRVY